MNSILNIDIDKFKSDLIYDPISVYKYFYDISKRYTLSPELNKSIILFGSFITEYLERENNLSINERSLNDINNLGNDLINKIIDEVEEGSFKNEVTENILKNHFLNLRPSNKSVFACEDISKQISDNFSLKNFSLDLKIGEITGLVGENGNGKTSLLRIIAGELKSDGGELSFPYLDNGKLSWSEIKRKIGYVKQNIAPWRGINNVEQQLKYIGAIKGITGKINQETFDYIIQRLSLNQYYKKQWDELSGGFKLRFELAKQLIWSPKLLILDEPLANLDIKTQLMFLSDLRSLTNSISNSMAVIISSQNIYEIEKIADQIVFIKNGKPFYYGRTNEVGTNNNFRCYQVDTSMDYFDLQRLLKDAQIIEIRNDSFYKLVYTSKEVTAPRFLKILVDQNIPIISFRDITNSTRLLFEQ